jgi:hypothetical protein
MLYQGQLVTDVLNWAGLIVNGLIAFVLPVVLCYYFYVIKSAALDEYDAAYVKKLKQQGCEMSVVHKGYDSINSYEDETSTDMPSTVPYHAALFDCLVPYRSAVIIVLFFVFVLMISVTIVMDLVHASNLSS